MHEYRDVLSQDPAACFPSCPLPCLDGLAQGLKEQVMGESTASQPEVELVGPQAGVWL